MHSNYQHHATHYADLALSVHERIGDLHRRAERLAPAVEESAAGSGCTDQRPDESQHPRSARAWDYVAEALSWNAISDDPTSLAAAEAAEAAGLDYRITWTYPGTEPYGRIYEVVIAPESLEDLGLTHPLRDGAGHSTDESDHLYQTDGNGCVICRERNGGAS